MKTVQRFAIGAFSLSSVVLGTTGCINVQQTRYNNPPRLAVAFDSDHAARTFYETLQATNQRSGRTEKHASVSLLLINVDERTVEGPNWLYNQAVQFCDINADAIITDFEAEVFAREWPKHCEE